MKYLWTITAFFLCSAGPALAASEHLTEASWTDLRYRTINFLLFAIILLWLLSKKVRDFYVTRRTQIAKELRTMEEAQREAERRLAEVEARIANLNKEGESILEEYRRQGESIERSIIARAEDTARQITEQAKFAIDNEAKMAADNLRNAVADMVVETTEQMLIEQLGPEEHERLINKYLNKVVLN